MADPAHQANDFSLCCNTGAQSPHTLQGAAPQRRPAPRRAAPRQPAHRSGNPGRKPGHQAQACWPCRCGGWAGLGSRKVAIQPQRHTTPNARIADQERSEAEPVTGALGWLSRQLRAGAAFGCRVRAQRKHKARAARLIDLSKRVANVRGTAATSLVFRPVALQMPATSAWRYTRTPR